MTASVTPIRPDMGPVETDFERDAVEALLGTIRKLRETSGLEPNSVAYTVITTGEGTMAFRSGYVASGKNTGRHTMALAAAALAKDAVGDWT